MPDSQLDARLTSQQVLSLPRAAALYPDNHSPRGDAVA
jgi:hypothetical protein